ncbi:ATP phosphoribosyltransferase [Caminibacter pacificus]|uniref:ATP phosphoribosyltransferase n=1 Tax=Caminibacter pacificus TaxID=1424653 RepID=A0AAJ4RCW3_9BACT|nr:ATP phosphoribosyltransferase [Caminibacter pacificus]NPA87232.1 ATP phosphoribosyltransferase [Campylobacterota bacterium]QCI28724.1 ATP phosphoribosyltransferase [Caminibacter pacificus]ROR40542.1 ATP phosphoribosyltransferase [Caminibacter pacificus]
MTIALPKGRIAEDVLAIFKKIFNEDFEFESRKLILKKAGFTFLNVRNWDVATYVEKQAADIGVVGYDVITELRSDVLELMDLGLGKCRVSVGGIKGDDSYKNKSEIVVASKLANIAKDYFSKQGIPAEVIKLNGSIELAPLVGLSDVIVDIVETGSTLRENGLEEKEVIMHSSARIIANKNSFLTRKKEILSLIEKIKEVNGA